jgi:hypothetical protein
MVLIASLLTGCSKAVVIPGEELTRDEYRKAGDYRIKMHGWNEYHARQFSVTDSTVVIGELKQSDDRYKLKKHDMPIVIPREQVEYVGVMKTDWLPTTLALLSIGTVVGYFAWLLATWDGFGD